MADGVVSFVLEKLADPLIRESLLLYGVGDEVEWLQRELGWMKSFLKDAESKRRVNQMIKNWVKEVRDVAQQAEDIIDTFTIDVESKKKKRSGLLHRIKRYAAFPCDVKSRHKVGKEIEGLRAKIDDIEKSRVRYGLVNLPETTPLASAADETLQARRRIFTHLNDSTTLVVGLDVHNKEIEDRLLNPNIKRRSVVSIVGIGGLGKTTLANSVYNTSRIKEKFDVSACISVSQDYKVHDVYKVLVNQMMGNTMAELQCCAEFELSKMLREFLMHKRYLIVLDDVWSGDVWDHLIRAALPDVKNGSRVLLTTRNMDVATSIDPTILPYELPFLNEDDSWALFLNKAFLPYQEESFSRWPEELEGIGRRLVKRCGGLPLALEVLGGILSKKPNSVAWTSVIDHFDWGSTDKGGDCSKILGLSYENLPHHHLKSCFLYLGVFPEDSVIEAQHLIELWIAEGFIPHELETHLTMEDTAHAYLEELADRSMIQVVDKDWLGCSASVSFLRIHDLFRDLCIREATENDFFNICNIPSNSGTTGTLQDTVNIHGKNLRRLVVHGDISTTAADLILPRNLKSILHFGTGETPSIIIPNVTKLLRVIHFVGVGNRNDEKFPKMFDKMITNMRHLRYLRWSGDSNIGFLPPCIRNLCNLQTLHLRCNVYVLPDWLGEMRTLRHLYLNNYNPFRSVACLADVGSLTNLRTLDVGIDASEGGWMERGLEKLVNIRILKVRHVKEEQGRLFIDSLRKMKYLSILVVVGGVIPIELFSSLSENTHWRHMSLWGPMSVRQLPVPAKSLSGFPSNLTTLKLWGSELMKDPMATLEKLPYLRVLTLSYNSYIGKKMVCTSGGFPRLQELFLNNLEELEEWRVEDGVLPNLTVLDICDCEKLMTLPEGLQHLRSLRTLKLRGYSAEDRVRREVGEDWYKIQHVTHITLDGHLI